MTVPANAPGGKRLSGFDQDIADLIVELIAEGESVRAICRRKDMPAMSTVFKWLAENPAFALAYSAAMDVRAAGIFDEILEIADNPQVGRKTKKTPAQGKAPAKTEVIEGDMIEHRRLRVDSRKWVLARMSPRKYGDKMTHASDPENPLPAQQVTIFALPDNGRG